MASLIVDKGEAMLMIYWAVKHIAIGLACGGLLASSAADAQTKEEKIEPTEKQMKILLALTPSDFQRTVEVADDDLDTFATLNTSNGYRNRGRFTDVVRSDNFLRAFVEKRSGTVRYQLYQTITYSHDFRNFRSANYRTAAGPVSADLTNISSEVLTCAYKMCVRTDAVGFDVPETTLRQIAATYAVGSSPLWRFKFNAQNGINWYDQMTPAEAAGLLAAVDVYQAKRTSK